MKGEVDYEQVGRFIYGFVRVKSEFDSFCQELETGTHRIAPEMPVSHYVDRTQASLVRSYGASSSIVSEFIGAAAIMRCGDDWMSAIKKWPQSLTVPGNAEIDRLLSVQAKLVHLRQMMSAT